MWQILTVGAIGAAALSTYVWQQFQVWRNYWRGLATRMDGKDVTRNPSAQTIEARYNERTFHLVCDNINSVVKVAMNTHDKTVRLSYMAPQYQSLLGAGQSDSQSQSIPVFNQLSLYTRPSLLADVIVADELLLRDFGRQVLPHLSLFDLQPSLYTMGGWLHCHLYPTGPSWGRDLEKFYAIVDVLTRMADRIEEAETTNSRT